MNIQYQGASDIGNHREVNEDFIAVKDYDDNTIFGIVTDGAGSKNTGLQPGSLIATEIIRELDNFYKYDKNIIYNYTEILLTEAMRSSGKMLGAFKMGNDEIYGGLGASATAFIYHDNKLSVAHVGNTRLYLIRMNQSGEAKLMQLTKDQTLAQEMVDKGEITKDDYYLHPDRLSITGGLGVVAEPNIQHFQIPVKENDLVVLTTDGIHYAIQSEYIKEIAIRSENCEEALNSIMQAARMQDYPDNMASIMMFFQAEQNIKQ